MSSAAFRLRAVEPSEDEIHVTVAQFLDRFLRPPALWFPYPAGVCRLTPHQQAQMSRFGVKRGLPDIWVLYGGLYLIELKTRRGGLSKTRIVRTRSGAPRILEGQADVFPKLIETGAVEAIAICESLDQVIAELRRWEIPIRMPLKTSAEPA